MTREEMRYKLNELRMMLNDGEHGEEQGILVEIIKELDKAENKGNLISRQAVLDELKRWDWQDLYLPSQFKQLLDDIPSGVNKGEWVPINDIEDIPKNGSYWVTMDFVFSTDVEKIRWSDVWRCWVDYDTDEVLTKESASLIIAYMPYFEPEPYYKGAKMDEPQKCEGIDLTVWTEMLVHPNRYRTGK